jgi:hypothetical protein
MSKEGCRDLFYILFTCTTASLLAGIGVLYLYCKFKRLQVPESKIIIWMIAYDIEWNILILI